MFRQVIKVIGSSIVLFIARAARISSSDYSSKLERSGCNTTHKETTWVDCCMNIVYLFTWPLMEIKKCAEFKYISGFCILQIEMSTLCIFLSSTKACNCYRYFVFSMYGLIVVWILFFVVNEHWCKGNNALYLNI